MSHIYVFYILLYILGFPKIHPDTFGIFVKSLSSAALGLIEQHKQ